MMSTFKGLQIVRDRLLVVPIEDWSGVRSKGRARRRRALGFRQNIVKRLVADPNVYVVGGQVFMHPEIADRLERAVRLETRAHEAWR